MPRVGRVEQVERVNQVKQIGQVEAAAASAAMPAELTFGPTDSALRQARDWAREAGRTAAALEADLATAVLPDVSAGTLE